MVLGLGGKLLGCVGLVSEELAGELDLPNRPALMEVDFDLLVEHSRHAPPAQPVPRHPAVRRDIAVVLEENVRWADLRRCVLESAPQDLDSLEFFDVYRGKQIPAGKKSIAFSVILRSPERTLTSEEADAAHDQIVAALRERLGAELRQA